jgi:hypothetical protein
LWLHRQPKGEKKGDGGGGKCDLIHSFLSIIRLRDADEHELRPCNTRLEKITISRGLFPIQHNLAASALAHQLKAMAELSRWQAVGD